MPNGVLPGLTRDWKIRQTIRSSWKPYQWFWKDTNRKLNGHLKVWDNNTGELLAQIDRKSYFVEDKTQELKSEFEDTLSDYESGSPVPRRDVPQAPQQDQHRLLSCHRWCLHCVRFQSTTSTSPSVTSISITITTFACGTVTIINDSAGSSRLVRDLSDSGSNISNRLSPIWCMDYLDNLIVIGCADGRLEFWEGTTGKLKSAQPLSLAFLIRACFHIEIVNMNDRFS
ncbi:hypothetical protein NQ317_012892 [Molorchus minor]|uniref:Uncharacterized protein n=1 Tax=Molorchus minor TaxID=1323400 RepID=A0ABQ9JQ58_9CUCU|nr:hypothetical protein NQ317_012892 [Molorchus minor]